MITIKVNFKVKTTASDKEGHYIIIKSQFSKKTTILNVMTERASKYTKQTILQPFQKYHTPDDYSDPTQEDQL